MINKELGSKERGRGGTGEGKEKDSREMKPEDPVYPSEIPVVFDEVMTAIKSS